MYTHTYRCLSSCEEVENRTSQLVVPQNFPHPRNTTVLYEFDLITTRIIIGTNVHKIKPRSKPASLR